MKRFLLFTFIMLMLLSTNANAATVTYEDAYVKVSLKGPDVDPGYSYPIEISGTNKSGNWISYWFYVDTINNYVEQCSRGYASSPFTVACSPSPGFTGPHTFILTVQYGTGGMGWNKTSIELAVRKDIKKMAADICSAIKDLSGGAFKNNPEQRKNAFCNKTDEVIQLIESAEASTDPTAKKQYYQEAINKLQIDIGAKMDSHAGGDSKDDWIIEQYQPPIYKKVQELVGELVNLL